MTRIAWAQLDDEPVEIAADLQVLLERSRTEEAVERNYKRP